MVQKNSDLEIPPGFTTPLIKNVPTSISSKNATSDQECNLKNQIEGQGEGPVCYSRRRSIREKAYPDFFVPTHFRPSVCRKVLSEATSSQPVKRRRGRPPKQRPFSSVGTVAPSMEPTEAPAVTPPPVPPPGSSMGTPVQISSDEGEEHRETKINMDPLSLLSQPPMPHLGEECSPHMDGETMARSIAQAKSLLVTLLTSGSTKNVEDMVVCANNTFHSLDLLHADYSSFYKYVKDFIAYHRDLRNAEKQKDNQSFLELEARMEDAKIRAKNLKHEIDRTQIHVEKIMKKREPLEAQIQDATELICKLKQTVAVLEKVEESLKQKKHKCIMDHKLAEHEVQVLGTQLEAAQKVLSDIRRDQKAALNGIESTTSRLKSM